MRRRAISGYVEAFILIAVVIIGSSLVFAVVSTYASDTQGPVISVSDLTIRQGTGAAVERFIVSNTGTVAATSVYVATSGVATGAMYCYSVSNPSTLSSIASTCPTLSTFPAQVLMVIHLSPGNSAVVEMTFAGNALVLCALSNLVVGTGNGALATEASLVVPA